VRTSAKRRERLRELELDDASIARLHAPVGLAIGSKRPMEVAIAILAELIALRRAEPAP
jgi:xanthine dehydrogenase accessory factor